MELSSQTFFGFPMPNARTNYYQSLDYFLHHNGAHSNLQSYLQTKSEKNQGILILPVVQLPKNYFANSF